MCQYPNGCIWQYKCAHGATPYFFADILMDVFTMVNVVTAQRCRYYTIIPMDVFYNMYALMVQLGTSCSSDSPGLARNEPTPGKRSQGDSTL